MSNVVKSAIFDPFILASFGILCITKPNGSTPSNIPPSFKMSYKDPSSILHREKTSLQARKVGYEPSSESKMGLDYNAKSAICDKIELLVEQKLDAKLDKALEAKLEAKVKPLQNKITELEAENRRMKIALRFLESELKECMKSNKSNNYSKPGLSPKFPLLSEVEAKKRMHAMQEHLSQLPRSDPKKLKLIEDSSSMNDVTSTMSEKSSDQFKIPQSADKMLIAREERAKNVIPSQLTATKSMLSSSTDSATKNQLYLAIPSSNNSTNLVPLVLQSSKPVNEQITNRTGSPLTNERTLPPNSVAVSLSSTPPSRPNPSLSPQKSTPLSNEKTRTPAAVTQATVTTNGLKDSSVEDDEIEVVPPPPPKSPLAFIDLSDEEGDPKSYDIPEVLPGPECQMHPMTSPVLPFVVADEKSMPPPTLKARTGLGKDGKKAVVLRMESKISGRQNLQYRVFSYFENASEPVKDRRWKQLTCIKVQSGRVCECTLTHLMEKVRYHFVVCLVQGNNRSKFSNCAPHVY